MAVFNLNKILGINIINSSNSEKRFTDIKNLINSTDDKEIVLDLDSFDIQDRSNQDFMDIISDPRVSFNVYENKDLADYINLYSMLSTGRQTAKSYVTPIKPKEYVDEELERFKETFKNVMKVNGNEGYIRITDAFGFINRDNIINAIFYNVNEFLSKNKQNKFIIDFTDCETGDSQVDILAIDILKIKNKYPNRLNVVIPDARLKNTLSLAMNMREIKNFSAKDKLKILDEHFVLYTAGILTSYVTRGKKDMYGRSGNGKVATNLPAIYLGRKGDVLAFRVFRAENFETRDEYMFEHDYEEHPGLKSEIRKCNINDIGLAGYWMGSEFQFNLPIQYKPDQLYNYYKQFGDSTRLIKVSLPQHMKMVFDDFGIKYDDISLRDSIVYTKSILREKYNIPLR